MKAERALILELIDEATAAGARQWRCCQVLGLDVRTLQRWRGNWEGEDRRRGPHSEPANKLSTAERCQIIEFANSAEFRDVSPKQMVPILADRGTYVGSESTCYRVLHEVDQVSHRSPTQPATAVRPRQHEADGPCQVLSWDITYLRSPVRGLFYYLYLIVDVWSRKIVGWEVHEEESMDLSSALIQQVARDQALDWSEAVLHSDNGGPMKGSTMLATLDWLGITASFSRPRVSNDNAYSESLFRTLKYRPEYPQRPFASIQEAREWVNWFVGWYNAENRHSAISFVTPDQRHKHEDVALLKNRKRVYEAARRLNPNRWSGKVRNWGRIETVRLNPQSQRVVAEERLSEAA
jgi:putative transposase